MTWNMMRDCVAQTTGTHHLADFYAEQGNSTSKFNSLCLRPR